MLDLMSNNLSEAHRAFNRIDQDTNTASDWFTVEAALDDAQRWKEFPTKEDVEAGAKAMYERDDAYDLPWSDQSERNGVRNWYRDKVRAAFEAINKGPL